MTKPRQPIIRAIPVTYAHYRRMRDIAHTVSPTDAAEFDKNAEQEMREGNSCVVLLLNNSEPLPPAYSVLHTKLIVSDFLNKFNGINI